MNARIASAAMALAAVCACLLPARADVNVTQYDEAGFSAGRDYVHQQVGEHIDPFTGNLTLQFDDLIIRGPGGFDLKVHRAYNRLKMFENYSPFGRGWDIHFGRVEKSSSTCATANPQSMTLQLPDGSSQTLHKSNGLGLTTTSDYLTTQLWKGQCVSNGINVFSPDGTKYEMTEQDGPFWHVKRITDRNGNWLAFNYSTAGMLHGRKVVTSISSSDNRSVTFSYSSNRLTNIQGEGRQWNYVIDSNSNGHQLTLVQVQTLSPSEVWRYTYNASIAPTAGSFALATMVNYFGGVTRYTYGFANFLPGVEGWEPATVVTRKTAGSDQWNFTYNPGCPSTSAYDQTTVALPGGVGSITYKHFGYCTVAAGSVWKAGLLYEKTSGSEQTETLTWGSKAISNESQQRPGYNKFDTTINRAHLTSRVVRRDGRSYTSSYGSIDDYGNPGSLSESGTDSRSHSFTYQNTNDPWIIGVLKSDQVGSLNALVRTFNDATGNMTSESRFGVRTDFGYDGDGNLSSKRNDRGFPISYRSYHRGVAGIEDRPEGVTITRDADDVGNVTRESDGLFSRNYGYDALDRVKSIDYPAGASATISWSAASRTLTRGSFTETGALDDFGRVTRVTRAGVVRNIEYDALGRKKSESFPDASNLKTTFTYDILNRITSSQVSNKPSRTYTYDANGSVSVQDENNKTTRYSYNRYGDPDQGFLTQIATPDFTTAMSRNAVGTMLSVTQGGVQRTYGRNTAQFLTSITEPETGTTTFGRDAVGNMTSKAVGGTTVNYSYDGLDRVETIAYSGASAPTISMTYDKRSKVTDVDSSVAKRHYEYDQNGNLTRDRLIITATPNTETLDVSYDYDTIDRLVSMTYPQGRGTITYDPDLFGRPRQVGTYADSITYRSSGNLAGMRYGNGVSMSFGEDSIQRPNSVLATSIQLNLAYTYDNAGNVASINGTNGPNNMDRTFAYDGSNRLTMANGPWGTGSIAYDDRGNITRQRFGTDYQIDYSYPASNRLDRIFGDRNLDFSYDTKGNVTTNGEYQFAYDGASNLVCDSPMQDPPVACTSHAEKATYGYDGKGWRVWRLEPNGRKTYFHHAANGDLVYEFSPQGDLWKQHIYLNGKRIATRESELQATTITLAKVTVSGEDYLRATVSPLAATGTVKFRQIEGLEVSGQLVNGVAQIPLDGFACGAHWVVRARYLGDLSFQPSTESNEVEFVVERCPTNTAIYFSPADSANEGQVVTVTASVSWQNGGIPVGSVTFRDGASVIGSPVSIDSSGMASLSFSGLAPGTHTIRADYEGDPTHTPSGRSATYVINGPPNDAPLVFMTSPAPGTTVVTGQVVTLSATASDPDADGAITSVTFLQDGASVGPGAPAGIGVYSRPWSSSSVGTYLIAARAVDNRNASATSAPIAITVTCPPPNSAPFVSITSPVDGQVLAGPLSMTLAASASDVESGLVKVEFFEGANKLGEDSTDPFTVLWPLVSAGVHTIRAVATDNCGNSTTSSLVTFTVEVPSGALNGSFETPVVSAPTVDMPAESSWAATGAAHIYPASWLAANAFPAPPDGVQVGAISPGGSLSQNAFLPPGTYVVTVKGTVQPNAGSFRLHTRLDDVLVADTVLNATYGWKESRSLEIRVADAGYHALKISNNATPAAGPAIALDDVRFVAVAPTPGGDNMGFEYPPLGAASSYQPLSPASSWISTGPTYIATNATLASVLMPPAPEGTQVASFRAPNSIRKQVYLAAGTYAIRFWGARLDGQTAQPTSARVTFNGAVLGEFGLSNVVWNVYRTSMFDVAAAGYYELELGGTGAAFIHIDDVRFVGAISPPTVALTSPINGQAYEAGNSIVLTATAADPDSGVAKVEFYAGAVKLGEDTTGPYNFTWTNVLEGTYVLTAVVTDESGATTTSAPVTIDVDTYVLPVFRGVSEAARPTGPLAFPNGTQPGDWLVFYVISTSDVVTPADWTLLRMTPWAGTYRSYVFARQAFAATTVPIATTAGGAIVVAYGNTSGIGTVGEFVIGSTSGGSITAPAIAPQFANSLVLGIATDRDAFAPSSPNATTRLSTVFASTGHSVVDKAYGGVATAGPMLWYQQSTVQGAIGIILEVKPERLGRVMARQFEIDFNADGKEDLVWTRPAGQTQVRLMNGAGAATSVTIVADGATYAPKLAGDFDGNGKSDLLMRNAPGTSLAIGTMNGSSLVSTTAIASTNGCTPTHTGDFNADGKSDIVCRYLDGHQSLLLMNGNTVISATTLAIEAGWRIVGVADFDGNGRSDLLWVHTDGRAAVWTMNGATAVAMAEILPAGTGWSPANIGDFNGDARADIVWKHTDGRYALYLMKGTAVVESGEVMGPGTGWSVEQVADFDGDGKSDLLWKNVDGRAAMWMMNGMAMVSGADFGGDRVGWKPVQVRDANRDGRADIVWKHTDGRVAIWLMNGMTVDATGDVMAAGAPEWTQLFPSKIVP